jgi:hypothetical protein
MMGVIAICGEDPAFEGVGLTGSNVDCPANHRTSKEVVNATHKRNMADSSIKS